MSRSVTPLPNWRELVVEKRHVRLTLGEVMDDLSRRLPPTGWRELRSRIENPTGAIYSAFHDVDAAELTTAHVEAYQRAVVAARAPKTAWGLRSCLSRVMQHAVDIGAAERNVVSDASTKMLPRNEPVDPERRGLEVLRPEQAHRIVTAHELALRPLWTAFLTTGMRSGEVAGLSWGDLSHDAQPLGEILIHRSYDSHRKELGPTKGRRPRRVPIHPAMREALERQVDWYRVRLGRKPHRTEPVFPMTVEGREPVRWQRVTTLRRWRRDLQAVDIPQPAAGPRSLHSTRHTFATALYRAEAPWRTIQTLTHSLPKQAADGCALPTYVAVGWEDLCEAILRLPYGSSRQAQAV